MKTILLSVLLTISVGCKKANPPEPIYQKIPIKVTNWPLQTVKVCMFFGNGGDPIVGCWDSEDDRDVFNKNDATPNQIVLVDISVTKEMKKALDEQHNRKGYCIRDTVTHVSCPKATLP